MKLWINLGAATCGIALLGACAGPGPRAPVLEDKSASPDHPDLGVNASLHGRRPFPANNVWNRRIDSEPVDPQSDELIAAIGPEKSLRADFGANWQGRPFGIPYVVVSGNTAPVPVSFQFAAESDPGPYHIPSNAPIEGGTGSTGDRHLVVVDRDHWRLYELFSAFPAGGGYRAGSGAIFDLGSNKQRPAGWTSADAAGLPIFPGLVRFDEVEERGEIRHALRFTVRRTRRAYVAPATHFASQESDPGLPPMGMRVRLRGSYRTEGFPPHARVILTALQRYGMILADNGSDWYLSGAPDPRWRDDELQTLKRVLGRDLEVIQMGPPTTH